MASRRKISKGGTGFGGKTSLPSSRTKGKLPDFARKVASLSPASVAVNTFVSGLAAMAAAVLAPGLSFALPTGLEVRGGRLSVSNPDGSTLVIDQGTSRAVGDWSSFDIDNGEQVQIRQPNSDS